MHRKLLKYTHYGVGQRVCLGEKENSLLIIQGYPLVQFDFVQYAYIYILKGSKNDEGMSKGHRNQFECAPDSQSSDNFSNKIMIVMDL